MSTTDDRIIEMQFDNADFERRLSQTLQSLDKLNESIANAGAKNGLQQLSNTTNSFDPSHMESALDAIQSKFSVLGAVGFSAIQKVTQSVMGLAGNVLNMAKTDILSPIITGGKSRATALEQAKFQFQGLGIDVNKGMASALAAVKGTAFGLDEAASVAAQFGASGIKAGDQMTRALTGISGIAAMTGRSYSEIGQIFTSAAGAGKVSNMDLQEFAIRGLNAAAAYAKETGKTEAQVHAMATAGTLDFASFADAMDKAFGAHATQANQTYTGALSNLHAALSRLGAAFYSTHIDQMRDIFNALTPVIDNLTAALGPLFDAVLKVTGEGSTNMVKFLGSLNFAPYAATIKDFAKVIEDAATLIHTWVGIIETAFSAIFPPNLAEDLEGIASLLDSFVKALTPTGPAVSKMTTVMEGLFSIFSIIGAVIKGVAGVIGSFFDAFAGANAGGALTSISGIAAALVKLQQYLVASGRIAEFFQNLSSYAKDAATWVDQLLGRIKSLFTTSDAGTSSINKAGAAVSGIHAAVSGLSTVLSTLNTYLSNFISHVVGWFQDLGQAIANSITPDTFQTSLSAVNTGLLAGIALLLKGFLDKGFKFDIGGGVFGQIETGLKSLNTTLQLMQTQLKAKTLMDIAVAIGVLAASIVVLSLIKPAALTNALAGMALGFGELVIVMKQLDTIGGTGGGAKLALLGTAMVAMASSVLVLSGAIAILASLNPDSLTQGLVAVTVALTTLTAAAKLLSGSSIGVAAAGLAMTTMASGLVILAGAVRIFAAMSWTQLEKGLGSVAAALLIIAATMQIMPVASTVAAGLAMIPLATGLNILAGAIRLFATMSWSELRKGLVGMAGGLVIIAVAMSAMPMSLPVTATGLLLVAIALGAMVPSIKMLGDMNITSLGKALGALALMLGILAVGMNLMTGALPGAAALLVVSAALTILAKVIDTLGSMSWSTILTGLGALAATLLVLGLGAAVLEPLIPALLALGAAMTLVGIGFALFGAGAFLVATAFAIMATSGAAGVAAIILAIDQLLKALPGMVSGLIVALEKSATEMLNASPALLKALGEMLTALTTLIVKQSPNIANALVAIITSALSLIRKKFPDVAQTMLDLLTTLLKTIAKNMPNVVNAAVSIVVNLVNGLANNAGRLVTAAGNLIIKLLAGIANQAGRIVASGLNILLNLLAGIARGAAKIPAAVGNIIGSFIGGVANMNGRIITAGANALAGFIFGIGNNAGKIVSTATSVVIKFINGISSNAVRLVDAAGNAIVTFLWGIDAAINKYLPQIKAAGLQIAEDLADGLTGGLASKAAGVAKAAGGVASKAIGAMKSVASIFSPSKKTMELGQYLGDGLVLGLQNSQAASENAAVQHAEAIVKAFSDSLAKVPDTLEEMGALSPTITPVLDLTQVQKAAVGINGMLTTKPISPVVSTAQANTIATATQKVAETSTQTPAPTTTSVTFNQTNNSPKALSTNDIYKNTKSQIAQAKEELGIS